MNSRNDLEEERRLFYVALTRAKNRATLSYAASRFKWGNFINCEPSRFIEEIDPSYIIESRTKKTFSSKKTSSTQPDSSKNIFTKSQRNLKRVNTNTSTSSIEPSDLTKINVGSEVMHERFGKGKIIELQGDFPNTKATVFFPSSGQKQLLLKFAKLQLI